MWDIDSIIRNNNQVAIDYMMRGIAVESAQSPQPQTWSLTLLAAKLHVGPPVLSELLKSFVNYETLENFLDLVRKFLPEYEQEILGEDGGQRVYRFCYLFGKKYYPLPSYASHVEVGVLVVGLPVELMGMSYSAYHELSMRDGYLLLLSLVEYPYEGDERDEEDDAVPFDVLDKKKKSDYKPSVGDIAWLKDLVSNLAVDGEWIAPMGFSIIKTAENKIRLKEAVKTPAVQETIRRTLLIAQKLGIITEFSRMGRTSQEKISGARVPLLDAVKRKVGAGQVKLIPSNGWTNEDLHLMTDGTPYEGVGHFADWVCSETSCVVLNTNYENCSYIEGDSEPTFEWSQRNVEMLTEDWPKVQEYRAKIDHIVEWLEVNPVSHFQELIEFLNTKAIPGKKKQPKAIL